MRLPEFSRLVFGMRRAFVVGLVGQLIATIIVAFAFVGDGLRDAAGPRGNK